MWPEVSYIRYWGNISAARNLDALIIYLYHQYNNCVSCIDTMLACSSMSLYQTHWLCRPYHTHAFGTCGIGFYTTNSIDTNSQNNMQHNVRYILYTDNTPGLIFCYFFWVYDNFKWTWVRYVKHMEMMCCVQDKVCSWRSRVGSYLSLTGKISVRKFFILWQRWKNGGICPMNAFLVLTYLPTLWGLYRF